MPQVTPVEDESTSFSWIWFIEHYKQILHLNFWNWVLVIGSGLTPAVGAIWLTHDHIDFAKVGMAFAGPALFTLHGVIMRSPHGIQAEADKKEAQATIAAVAATGNAEIAKAAMNPSGVVLTDKQAGDFSKMLGPKP